MAQENNVVSIVFPGLAMLFPGLANADCAMLCINYIDLWRESSGLVDYAESLSDSGFERMGSIVNFLIRRRIKFTNNSTRIVNRGAIRLSNFFVIFAWQLDNIILKN